MKTTLCYQTVLVAAVLGIPLATTDPAFAQGRRKPDSDRRIDKRPVNDVDVVISQDPVRPGGSTWTPPGRTPRIPASPVPSIRWPKIHVAPSHGNGGAGVQRVPASSVPRSIIRQASPSAPAAVRQAIVRPNATGPAPHAHGVRPNARPSAGAGASPTELAFPADSPYWGNEEPQPDDTEELAQDEEVQPQPEVQPDNSDQTDPFPKPEEPTPTPTPTGFAPALPKPTAKPTGDDGTQPDSDFGPDDSDNFGPDNSGDFGPDTASDGPSKPTTPPGKTWVPPSRKGDDRVTYDPSDFLNKKQWDRNNKEGNQPTFDPTADPHPLPTLPLKPWNSTPSKGDRSGDFFGTLGTNPLQTKNSQGIPNSEPFGGVGVVVPTLDGGPSRKNSPPVKLGTDQNAPQPDSADQGLDSERPHQTKTSTRQPGSITVHGTAGDGFTQAITPVKVMKVMEETIQGLVNGIEKVVSYLPNSKADTSAQPSTSPTATGRPLQPVQSDQQKAEAEAEAKRRAAEPEWQTAEGAKFGRDQGPRPTDPDKALRWDKLKGRAIDSWLIHEEMMDLRPQKIEDSLRE